MKKHGMFPLTLLMNPGQSTHVPSSRGVALVSQLPENQPAA